MIIPHPVRTATLITLASLTIYGYLLIPINQNLNKTQSYYNPCKLTESEVRQLWATSRVYGGNTSQEQNATALTLIQAAENLCNYSRNSTPTPLPENLKSYLRN